MRTKDSFAAVVVAFLWSVKNALCRQIYSQMQHTVYYLTKITIFHINKVSRTKIELGTFLKEIFRLKNLNKMSHSVLDNTMS